MGLLTLTGGTHLSPWKRSNQPISEPESDSAGIPRKSSVNNKSQKVPEMLAYCWV